MPCICSRPFLIALAACLQSMILSGHGSMPLAPPPGQRWLYEIVANGRNNIDVDKVWDDGL
jgi:hypothetical protein